MTDKEIVQDLLQRVPDNVSLRILRASSSLFAAVRWGLADLDDGQSFPIEDVEQELPSWIIA